MKTRSCWGYPPSRIYRFINSYGNMFDKVCVIGCSDGKFVFPFLRKGYDVTAIDMDVESLYGGFKEKPIDRPKSAITKQNYRLSKDKLIYKKLPVESVKIMGLAERAKIEKLETKLHIICGDAYHNVIGSKYDVVFTSCSLQYKSNRDLKLKEIMLRLKSYVNPGGFLYMDYMMPLEDSHEWKSELFFRTGTIKTFFDINWEIVHLYEMRKPVFEAAHIDRPEDHFHRFGYILARKIS